MTNEKTKVGRVYLSPANQIADFVRRYLGHLPPKDRHYVGGTLVFVMPAGWLVMRPTVGSVIVTASLYGPDEHEFVGNYKGNAPSLIQQAADRMADVLFVSGDTVDNVYDWLKEPVQDELCRRAKVMLNAARTIAPAPSPDSQAIEQARAVLRGAMNPTILPTDLIEIGIITDRHGICVTINKGACRLFTSRSVMPDRLIEALEDAAQFAELGMPYDDGGMAAMSVRGWIARLSVVSDLRRILGVTV